MANDRARPHKRKKVCSFCVDKIAHIDYKDTAKLRRIFPSAARSFRAAPPAPAPSISVS